MKRYEKMSKEEIMEVIESTLDSCEGCKIGEDYCRKFDTYECTDIISAWLNEEPKTKMVHRYETFKSPEDLDNIYIEWCYWCNNADCDKCKLKNGKSICFIEYMKAEIEVEE